MLFRFGKCLAHIIGTIIASAVILLVILTPFFPITWVHELGHAIMAELVGAEKIKIKQASVHYEAPSWKRVRIAFGGPASTFLVGIVLCFLSSKWKRRPLRLLLLSTSLLFFVDFVWNISPAPVDPESHPDQELKESDFYTDGYKMLKYGISEALAQSLAESTIISFIRIAGAVVLLLLAAFGYSYTVITSIEEWKKRTLVIKPDSEIPF